jgi:tripartite-type tricarboxylate transporter receptor subunit TctC
MFRALLRAAGATVVLAAIPAWGQQTFPSKPVRVMVGYTAGSTTDIIARILAQKLNEGLGQQVIVDNRPGASSNIASEMVAKAAPDGHTVMVVNNAVAVSRSLISKLGYDATRDLVAIAQICNMPHVLTVNASLPVKNAAELTALARRRPGELTFASAGVGVQDHISGEMYKHLAKLNLIHVPYKGGSQALADLAGGQVTMYFSGVPSAMTFIRNGKVKALAVTSAQRSGALPDVPTMQESGVPGYELVSWYGMFGTAGSPREALQRLNAEVQRILALPEVRERFAGMGLEPVGGSAEQFDKVFRAEIEKSGALIKAAGLRAD